MSSSYREKDKADEEPAKVRRGRPPKKREPSVESDRGAKGGRKGRGKEKKDEEEDKGPGSRTSRRTQGLPADEDEKESEGKRTKRNSLRSESYIHPNCIMLSAGLAWRIRGTDTSVKVLS